MAYMSIQGLVQAVITEDSDLLVYGCARVGAECGPPGCDKGEDGACAGTWADVQPLKRTAYFDHLVSCSFFYLCAH